MRDQKRRFVTLYETGLFTKSYLCREFGISRPTGDAILKRYDTEGWEALDERERRHGTHPLTTPPDIEDCVSSTRFPQKKRP